jgi:hypothetical protein
MGMLFTIREGKRASFEWSRDPEALLATRESEGRR